jgi:NAD(P)-dependent dehydrogenase (short-subunit alcohol dehydrogenase family)
MPAGLETASIAIITGAASGMGEAATRLMCVAGWSVLLCDQNDEALKCTAASLGVADIVASDIADATFFPALQRTIGDRPVGALIHCAGVSPAMGGPQRILEVNLAATMRLLDWVRPRMAEGGAAVLFASMAGHMLGSALDQQISKIETAEQVASLVAYASSPGAAYAVSKRGVQLLARREAARFGARGARIISVSPGVIDTPMGRIELASQPAMKALVDGSALQRVASAEEVAAVAVFLCSKAAAFVTGTDILVDGGAVAGQEQSTPRSN